MRVLVGPLAVLLLTAMALSGCVSGKDDLDATAPEAPAACAGDGFCAAEAVVDDTGRDLRTALTADDKLNAPTWQVGDVFEQHLYYGEDDGAGEHIQTMVVDDAGACYQFGTTSQTAARAEAVYDLPILGCIDKQSLQTSAFQTDWSWMYDFPLENGKTWDGRVEWIFNWNSNTFHTYEFTLTAVYDAAIDTPSGDFPGFEITGITPEGETFLEYNYVPAVGWFSHFWMYDLAAEDTSDIMFHAMSMGTSKGYTGPYHLAESETLIEEAVVVPFAVVDGATTVSFVVPEGTTQLQGVIAPIACPGVSKLIVITPGNQQEQYDHQYDGDPQACTAEGDGAPPAGSYTVHWVDRPAEAGEWRLVPTGAGAYGYFIWIEAVTDSTHELTAADLPQTAE